MHSLLGLGTFITKVIFFLFQAEILTNQEVKTVEDQFKAIKILLDKGCETVIITLGSEGAVFATQKDRQPVHVKIEPINNPVDPTVSNYNYG